MTISVETSIQSQCDEIGAVRYGFASVVATRGNGLTGNAPLWNFVWLTDNQPYINAVIGSTLLGVDTGVNAAQVGSGLFNQWFQLQNTYFSQNNASYPDPVTPTNRVSTLANAVANYFRWRIGYYFNQTMGESVGTANDVAHQNVFPAHATALGTAAISSTGVFSWTANANIPNTSIPAGTPQPFSTQTIGVTAYAIAGPTYSGPGVIGIFPTATVGATGNYSVTCIYEASPYATVTPSSATVAIGATVNNAAPAATSATAQPAVIVGESISAFASSSSSSQYTAGTGAILLSNTSQYVLGQKVLITNASLIGATAVYGELAEVYAINPNVSVSVCKAMAGPTPATAAIGVRYGATAFAATAPNSTNVFYGGGYVYPLFSGVTSVAKNSGGAANDSLAVRFQPDRPQYI